jgi:hypothetical protein
MSARVPYEVQMRCNMGEWHTVEVVDAVTSDEAISGVFPRALPDAEVRARESGYNISEGAS